MALRCTADGCCAPWRISCDRWECTDATLPRAATHRCRIAPSPPCPALPLQLLEAKFEKLEAGGIKSTAVLDLRKEVQSALAASKKVGG